VAMPDRIGRKHTAKLRILICALWGLSLPANFVPSTVTPRQLQQHNNKAVSVDSIVTWEPLHPPKNGGDGSGKAVSRILELLVPLHLRSHQSVHVVVHCRFSDLVRGHVDSVFLDGTDWHSRAGITARRLTISTPHGASLRYLEVLAGRITLTSPAMGMADAVFDASDFGNFLCYPPVAASAPVINGCGKFTFLRSGVVIDAVGRRVVFSGRCAGTHIQAALMAVDAAGGDVRVEVLHVSNTSSDVPATSGPILSSKLDPEVLARSLTQFFRTLYVDLAGVELRFSSVSFRAPLLLFRLQAVVRRIPNPVTDRI